MSIPTGRYKIVTTEDTHVSRANEEASDLDPKPIYTNTDDQDPTWVVEQLHNGNYILYVKSTPTAIMGDAVFALIIGQANRTEWHLAHHRDDSFRIQDTANGRFWTCYSYGQLSSQVGLRLLMPTSGEAEQLFKFVRVD